MGQSKRKKKNYNWSELCPDLLRCVFNGLSFADLNRAKSVCLSWYSASRGCIPKRNQIPWLIVFPNNKNKDGSCVLFIPEDRNNVYKTRELGVDFLQSDCLANYGSWLLMMDIHYNLNILNPFTGEKIDLPLTEFVPPPPDVEFLSLNMKPEDIFMRPSLACLWIDDRSKDYVVVWKMIEELVFAKKGHNNKWRRICPTYDGWFGQKLIYEHKAQKVYYHREANAVRIWCLSGDDPQQVFEDYVPLKFNVWKFNAQELYQKQGERYVREPIKYRLSIVVSLVSRKVLKVASAVMQNSKKCVFRVYKMHPIKRSWEIIDSLGDEAVILDMGITVIAKDIPGIKRNSIYFSGIDYGRKDPNLIFVFDLATHKIELLPQCVFSSIHFSDARWFFPGFSG